MQSFSSQKKINGRLWRKVNKQALQTHPKYSGTHVAITNRTATIHAPTMNRRVFFVLVWTVARSGSEAVSTSCGSADEPSVNFSLSTSRALWNGESIFVSESPPTILMVREPVTFLKGQYRSMVFNGCGKNTGDGRMKMRNDTTIWTACRSWQEMVKKIHNLPSFKARSRKKIACCSLQTDQ